MAADAPELIVQTPGDPVTISSDGATPAFDDASAARVAELEATVAQQAALISQLNAQVASVATVPNAPAATPGVRRTIGEDWGARTTVDAAAAGVKVTVLCSDGYYVPGA